MHLPMVRTGAARQHTDPELQRQAHPAEPLPQVPLVLDHGCDQAMERQHRPGRRRNVSDLLHPLHRGQDRSRDKKAAEVAEDPGPLIVHAQEW